MSTQDSVSTYPVYIIFSGVPVNTLKEQLAKFGPFGSLRVVYSNDLVTNRTVALLSKECYEALLDDGYCAFQKGGKFGVAPYTFKPTMLPKENQSGSLFVPVPGHFKDEMTSVSDYIDTKLKVCSDFGLIPENSWKLNIPLASRFKNGTIKNGCFITFNEGVKVEDVAAVKTVLDKTFWADLDNDTPSEAMDNLLTVLGPDTDLPLFKCLWASAQKNHNSKE